MLRITEEYMEDGKTTIYMEGRIAGPWVEEVRRISQALLAAENRLILDLAGVLFADRHGVALLRELQPRAELINCSPFLAEQLRH
ncbi:MAG: hypothetical protein ACKV2V_12995 [Blastocatellia bacterium]